jgi:hypothetical protein
MPRQETAYAPLMSSVAHSFWSGLAHSHAGPATPVACHVICWPPQRCPAPPFRHAALDKDPSERRVLPHVIDASPKPLLSLSGIPHLTIGHRGGICTVPRVLNRPDQTGSVSIGQDPSRPPPPYLRHDLLSVSHLATLFSPLWLTIDRPHQPLLFLVSRSRSFAPRSNSASLAAPPLVFPFR